MSETQVGQETPRRALSSAPVWLLALVLAGTLVLWQGMLLHSAGTVPPNLAHVISPQAQAWLAAAAQLLGNLVEACVYTLFWRRRGVAIPVLRYWVVLALLSNLDGIANALDSAARAVPAWLGAPLAGARVLSPGQPPANGFAAAFGGVGLLALTRVALTAEAQAHVGAPRRRAWLLVGACWLAFRLLWWWGFDMARGASSPR